MGARLEAKVAANVAATNCGAVPCQVAHANPLLACWDAGSMPRVAITYLSQSHPHPCKPSLVHARAGSRPRSANTGVVLNHLNGDPAADGGASGLDRSAPCHQPLLRPVHSMCPASACSLSLSLSVYLYLFVYHAPLRVRSAASTCVHARMLELAVCARARRRPCSSYALRHPTHAHSSLLLSLSCSRPLMYLSCTPRPVCITASAPAARHAMRQGGEQLGLCDYATAATHMSTHYNTH